MGGSGAALVRGPGVTPELGFACCDQGIGAMQTLFTDPTVIPVLAALHAQVAVAITDFSPQRASVVQRPKEAGIPTIAWILLPKDEGVFLKADNASAAATRVAAFEKWTSGNRDQIGKSCYCGNGTNISAHDAGFPSAGVPWIVESVPAGSCRLVGCGPSVMSAWFTS
jgi:hypothetical protein